MPKTLNQVIEALAGFVPGEVEGDTMRRLYQLLEGFSKLPRRKAALPAMFSLLERYPEADFGSPGPLVHAIEAIPGFEPELKDSLRRIPTPTAVWMVNRILNADLPQIERRHWLSGLSAAGKHRRATERAREDAREFLEYQRGRKDA